MPADMTIETLDELKEWLSDGGSDDEFETVEDVVDALVTLGLTDIVLVDDNLAGTLKSALDPDLLELQLDEVEQYDESNDPEQSDAPDEVEEAAMQTRENIQEGMKTLLEAANSIKTLYERPLTPELLERIAEDRMERGLDDD